MFGFLVTTPPTKPTGFRLWLATRHFGVFMRDGSGGCMSGNRAMPRETEFDVVSALCQSTVTQPEAWRARGEYTMRHAPSQVEIWTGNGRRFVNIYESPEGRFRLRVGSQKRLWRALHRLRHRQDQASDAGQTIKASLARAE